MSDEKKMRLFARNPDGEPTWAFCGDLPMCPSTRRAVADFVRDEIEADFGGEEGDRFTLEFKRQEMTDAEVDALPDM